MKLRPLVASLAMIGCSVTVPAYAGMLSATANGATGGGVGSYSDTMTDPSWVKVSGDAPLQGSSWASSYVWGYEQGTYKASAAGGGVFSSIGNFHRSLSITNTGTFAAAYSLNTYIYAGSIDISNSGLVTGNASGSYNLNIVQNNANNLFSSATNLAFNSASGYSLSNAGVALGGAAYSSVGNNASYSWGGTNLTLALGQLAAGASMTIDFDLTTTAFGNITDDGTIIPQCMSLSYGGAYCSSANMVNAALGDPFDYGPSGQDLMVVTSTPVAASVPEPGALALSSLGLLALGGMRRLRRRRV